MPADTVRGQQRTDSIGGRLGLSEREKSGLIDTHCGGLRHGGGCDALSTRNQFVRYLDDGMAAGLSHILARFDALICKSLAFREAHSPDRRLVVVGTEIARDHNGGNLLGEKTQTQSMHGTTL